jgi:hypothetical protein
MRCHWATQTGSASRLSARNGTAAKSAANTLARTQRLRRPRFLCRGVNRAAKKAILAEMPPAKVEPWILELSAYGFGGTASGMLRSTSLDRSRYQIPGAMGCYRQLSARPSNPSGLQEDYRPYDRRVRAFPASADRQNRVYGSATTRFRRTGSILRDDSSFWETETGGSLETVVCTNRSRRSGCLHHALPLCPL